MFAGARRVGERALHVWAVLRGVREMGRVFWWRGGRGRCRGVHVRGRWAGRRRDSWELCQHEFGHNRKESYRRSLECVSEPRKAYAAEACFNTEGVSPWRLPDSTKAVLRLRRRSCTAITPPHMCPSSIFSSLLLSSSSSSKCRVSLGDPYKTDFRS